MEYSVNRRGFLKGSLGVSAGAALGVSTRAAANDRVTVGIMGCGGRARQLLKYLLKRNDIEIKYLCDVDTRRFSWMLEAIESAGGSRPVRLKDFRKILDDKEVDVLFNATPDHWHALGTVMACQAGKDVYVEKPLALDINEGRKMIQAARKYERVVQVGTQTRSAPYVHEAREYIRSGKLGEVHLIRVCNMMQHHSRPQGAPEEVPAGFDWDFWCGPSPLSAYTSGRWWFERWAYSCGGIFGDAIHQLDLARMLLDLECPDSVQQLGGVRHFQDGREIPDTQVAVYEFGDMTLAFEGGLWMPYMKKIPVSVRDSDRFPEWRFCSTHVEVMGSEAMMFFGRQGGGWQVYAEDNSEPVASTYGRQADAEHLDNFFACVRSRQRPIADVEEGHRSTILAHLANISFRTGNRKLEFDSSSETFTNCPQANKYLRRSYRQPWVLPDEV